MKGENLEVLRDAHEGKEVENERFMGFEVRKRNEHLVSVPENVFVVVGIEVKQISAIDSRLQRDDAAMAEDMTFWRG